MRSAFRLASAVLGVALPVLHLVAPAAVAEPMAWKGSLSFEPLLPALPVTSVSGAGVATLNGSSGGIRLDSIRISGGIAGTATAPVTDPIVTASNIVALQVMPSLGVGTLSLSASSTLPVNGLARVCFLFSSCASGGLDISLHGATPSGSAGLGLGGLLDHGFTALRVSVLGAPWTAGTATIPIETSQGQSVAVFADGLAHGPFSFTGSTALPGAGLQLVSPLVVEGISGTQPGTMFVRLTLHLVPEPGRILLGMAGVGTLLVLARSRRLRRPR